MRASHDLSVSDLLRGRPGRKPFKVRQDPAQLAWQLLSRSNQTVPPTDLSRVCAFYPGLTVTSEDLSEDGYLLEFPDGSGEIIWNQKDSSTSKWRYTVAHELGHWVTNRFADRSDAESRYVDFSTEEEVERWCEQFAISLLVPHQWLTSYFGAFEGLRNAKLLDAGPGRFDVTKSAFFGAVFDLFKVVVLICSDEAHPSVKEVYPRFLERTIREAEIQGKFAPSTFRFRDGVSGPDEIRVEGSPKPIKWLAFARGG
jgi:Zn-dependent peptidase ImmA (M78 family)